MSDEHSDRNEVDDQVQVHPTKLLQAHCLCPIEQAMIPETLGGTNGA